MLRAAAVDLAARSDVAVVVLGVSAAAGVLPLVLGVAAVLFALAFLGAFGLAWLFADGLFSRHPFRNGFRKTIASPKRLATVVVLLVADVALLAWGIRAIAWWVGG